MVELNDITMSGDDSVRNISIYRAASIPRYISSELAGTHPMVNM